MRRFLMISAIAALTAVSFAGCLQPKEDKKMMDDAAMKDNGTTKASITITPAPEGDSATTKATFEVGGEEQ